MHDVCIIGSGFAGTFLGLRLAELGINTVIVEAGGEVSPGEALEGRTDLFPCEARGDAAFPVDFNRTIGIGGTSHKWNGVVSRFLPSDFKSRSEFGLFADWPFSYENLSAYYDQAEVALAAQPGRPIPGSERSAAPPLPGTDELGLVPLAFSVMQGAGPKRLHAVEIPRFLASRHGFLLSQRPAARLVAHDDGSITGVEVRGPDGAAELVRARYFVVAAGVVESARLLLVSTSRSFPEGIGNGLGLVGRYVHAHPRPRVHTSRAAAHKETLGVFRSYRFCDEFRRRGLAAACVDINFLESDPSIDITLEMEPAISNRIRLDPRRRDLWNRPAAVLECNATDLDRRTREHAASLHRELVSAHLAPGATAREAEQKCFHPAGGCRMGRDEREGVVDRNGRVFATDNMYVAGASVFPTSGASNPTLTVVALALRLGDHLAARINQLAT